MKLTATATIISSMVSAKPFHGEVRRHLQGDWVASLTDTLSGGSRSRRAEIDGEKGFRTLATMMLYMNGFGSDLTDPETHQKYDAKVGELQDLYTNYGCYCWIDGPAAGVIGGGKTRDMTDHHCKELYRCYKCVNIDYAKNYTDVEYSVDFTEDDDGNRLLDCKINSKQDAENICECDKRFAEEIANTVNGCKAGQQDDEMYGAYCMDEKFRTSTGNGNFNPRKQCEKQFPDHDKNKCCGFYPNRLPYDSNHADCCRMESPIEDVFKFRKMPQGMCADMGGEVVVSEAGNPNSYIAVASLLQQSNSNNNNKNDDDNANNALNQFAG